MPKVGIILRLDKKEEKEYLQRNYSQALYKAGATPIYLPIINDINYIRSCLDILDGILIPGSDTDVNPERYGEKNYYSKNITEEKESVEMLILKEAEQKAMPILGICYGMQILNVYRDGSLYQDIEAQVKGALQHKEGKEHPIRIKKDSLLFSLLRAEQTRVNSYHHQAVKKVGKGLKVAAESEDNIVEAIEDITDDKFILGVQWHPEKIPSEPLSSRIFETFVNRCKTYEQGKTRN